MVASGLRSLAAELRAAEAPARVESRLIAAFHGHTGLGIRRPRQGWVPVVSWFAAAAAMAVVALLLVPDRDPKPVRRVAPHPIQYAVAQVSPEPGDPESDFIPLPNTTQLALDEEVNLVRLEVPRSAMIALGYEVSADRAEEPVSADVMLGPDGVARAVRFLEE